MGQGRHFNARSFKRSLRGSVLAKGAELLEAPKVAAGGGTYLLLDLRVVGCGRHDTKGHLLRGWGPANEHASMYPPAPVMLIAMLRSSASVRFQL